MIFGVFNNKNIEKKKNKKYKMTSPSDLSEREDFMDGKKLESFCNLVNFIAYRAHSTDSAKDNATI